MNFRQLPPLAKAFFIFCCTIGMLIIARTVLTWPPELSWEYPSSVLGLILFSIFAYLTASKKIMLPGGKEKLGSMSVGYTLVFLTLFLSGVEGAVLMAVVSAVGGTLRSSQTGEYQPLHRVFFGIHTLVITAWLSGQVFLILGGKPAFSHREIHALPYMKDTVVPVMAAALTYYLVNTWIVSTIMGLASRSNVPRAWHENFLWTAPGYFAGASIALIGASLYGYINLTVVLLIAPIAGVIFYSYKIYMDRLHQSIEHLERQQKLYFELIQSLATAIAAKDTYTRQHIGRVEGYAMAMAERLKLSEDGLRALKTAALLHDVGKMGVPEHVLIKNGKLTKEDRERIEAHPEFGAEILAPIEFPWPVVPIVRHHHEHYDGTGYPDGLKGEEIPLGSRILALADTYDAITADRPYRAGREPANAIEIMRATSGAQFDPELVEVFADLVENDREELEKQIEETWEATGVLARSSTVPLQEATTSRDDKDKVFNEIARAHREAYALREISESLHRSQNASETIDLILGKIGNLVGYSACAVFLVDFERGELYARGTAGSHGELLKDLRIRMGNGITGKYANKRISVISKRPEDDFDSAAGMSADGDRPVQVGGSESDGCPFKSALVVPLENDDKLIGCISAYHTAPEAFSDDHLRLLSVIAPEAARAISDALEFERTREYAFTDELTGLGNRRLLNACLEGEMEKAGKQNRSVSLIAADIDGLKSINDTYGHDVGDEVLVHVAKQIRATVRGDDFVVRSGGDEFFAVIPSIGNKALSELEERLENAPALEGFVASTGHKIDIVLSVGYATYPDDAETSAALFRAADQRMYQDKRHRKEAIA